MGDDPIHIGREISCMGEGKPLQNRIGVAIVFANNGHPDQKTEVSSIGVFGKCAISARTAEGRVSDGKNCVEFKVPREEVETFDFQGRMGGLFLVRVLHGTFSDRKLLQSSI